MAGLLTSPPTDAPEVEADSGDTVFLVILTATCVGVLICFAFVGLCCRRLIHRTSPEGREEALEKKRKEIEVRRKRERKKAEKERAKKIASGEILEDDPETPDVRSESGRTDVSDGRKSSTSKTTAPTSRPRARSTRFSQKETVELGPNKILVVTGLDEDDEDEDGVLGEDDDHLAVGALSFAHAGGYQLPAALSGSSGNLAAQRQQGPVGSPSSPLSSPGSPLGSGMSSPLARNASMRGSFAVRSPLETSSFRRAELSAFADDDEDVKDDVVEALFDELEDDEYLPPVSEYSNVIPIERRESRGKRAVRVSTGGPKALPRHYVPPPLPERDLAERLLRSEEEDEAQREAFIAGEESHKMGKAPMPLLPYIPPAILKAPNRPLAELEPLPSRATGEVFVERASRMHREPNAGNRIQQVHPTEYLKTLDPQL